MVTSTGKPITHRDLILALLDSIQLPKQLTACKCAAHTKGTDPVSEGNRLADLTAKSVAANTTVATQQIIRDEKLDMELLKQNQQASSPTEKAIWKKRGFAKNDMDVWEGPTGKPVLPKNMFRFAAILSHGPCHVSTGGMISQIDQVFEAPGFQSYSKIFCSQTRDIFQHHHIHFTPSAWTSLN